MQHLLTELLPFVSHYGLWVIFFGMMVEGTMMILATGILCYLGVIPIKDAFVVATLGAIIGDQLWYYIGYKFTNKIFNKFPLLAQKVKKLHTTVNKRGALLSFSGRFVYGGAILFPFALGTYKFPYTKFTLFDTLGVSLWSCLGISLGYFLGTGVEQYLGKIEKVWHFFLLLALAYLLIYTAKRFLLNKRQ